MDSTDDFESLQNYLPKYLFPDQAKQLYQELKSFPDSFNYYLNSNEYVSEMLQGDGWKGFEVINFVTMDKKSVSGIVVSNTCDVSVDNERTLPVNILFAPIIPLKKYTDYLESRGVNEGRINNLVNDLKLQKITNLFFLPERPGLTPGALVRLDDIHSHPRENFLESQKGKLYTLSQYGFYVFLLKLSIHFSRFNEGIARFPKPS